MLNEILESLLKGELEVQDLIKWLQNESNKPEIDVFTKTCDTQADFIEYFTEYLYSKTTWVLAKYSNDNSSAKFTQRYWEKELDTSKVFSGLKNIAPLKNSEPKCWKKLPLNPDDTNLPSTSGVSRVGKDTKDEQGPHSSICVNPGSPPVQGRKSWTENTKRNSTPKSKANQNMCLGDFIVVCKSSSKKKKGKQKCSFSDEPEEKSSKDTLVHAELASAGRPAPAHVSEDASLPNIFDTNELSMNEEWPSLESTSSVLPVAKTPEPTALVCPKQPGSNTPSKGRNPKQRQRKYSKDGSLHEEWPSLAGPSSTYVSRSSMGSNLSQRESQVTIPNLKEREPTLASSSPVSKPITSQNLQDKPLSKDCPPAILKRINPINLSKMGVSDFDRMTLHDPYNVFSFEEINKLEICAEKCKLMRSLFRIPEPIPLKTPPESPPIQPCRSVEIGPELVNFRKQLDVLSMLYSAFIDLNLVLNVLNTLYYLICLATVNCYQLEKDDCLRDEEEELYQNFEHLFNSVPDCLYFATSVLNRQSRLLNVFDRPTIKLILEHSEVKIFSPVLIDKLQLMYNIKPERKPDPPRNTAVENVAFVVDTDNKDNFNSVPSFQAFRKQRDMFCGLLDLWKENHMKSQFRFAKAMGDKIRCLHYLHPDPVNCMHLARLFKNMLLKEIANAPASNSLNQFANVDAEKLNRLEDRLTSKQSTDGLTPKPSFPGNQEFYKEFIRMSNSHIFHRHLKNCFAAEILNLDDTDFWATDVGDSDQAVDAETKKQYVTCIKSTKLLAKFLSFMESLPYRTNKIIVPVQKVYQTQLAIRRHFIPEIHLIQRLKLAKQQGKLTLTIPWVVEYLASFDYVSLRLPYFKQTIDILYDIHYEQDITSMDNVEGPLMVNICLGWLFEQRHFPIDTYLEFLNNKYKHSPELDEKDAIVDEKPKYRHSIDLLEIVDDTAVYACCPYLYEIRNLLTSNSRANALQFPRSIRPIAACITHTEEEEKKFKLQSDVHELFYQNHPTSVRRVVEFVIERVTSAGVKFLVNDLIPQVKNNAVSALKKHLQHLDKFPDYDKKRLELNECCRRKSSQLIRMYIGRIKGRYDEEMPGKISDRCSSSIKALLADELFITIGSICVDIAVGLSKRNIDKWWSSHWNTELFQKEFTLILDKLDKDLQPRMARLKHGLKTVLQTGSFKVSCHIPPLGWAFPHNINVKGPSQLMMDTQLIAMKVIQEAKVLTYDELKFALDDARNTLSHRCDYSAKTVYQLCEIFYKMAISIVLHAPLLGKTPIFKDMSQFWKKYLIKKAYKRLFSKIISQNNLRMFLRSGRPTQTWDCLAQFVIELIKDKFLTDKVFANEAFRMFQMNWPGGYANYYGQFLQTVIDAREKAASPTFCEYSFCLTWLADFTRYGTYSD